MNKHDLAEQIAYLLNKQFDTFVVTQTDETIIELSDTDGKMLAKLRIEVT